MHAIGIAQAGQSATLGQQRQHVLNTGEKAFGPVSEVVEKRLRRPSATPPCNDARGKRLRCTPSRLKSVHPGRSHEPALPYLFGGEPLPQPPLQRPNTIDLD